MERNQIGQALGYVAGYNGPEGWSSAEPIHKMITDLETYDPTEPIEIRIGETEERHSNVGSAIKALENHSLTFFYHTFLHNIYT